MWLLTKIIVFVGLNLVILLLGVNFVTATKPKSDIKIVIIGTGPSGIAAASKLFENNFTNVVILEAEDRTGGRVYSIPFGENVVDLGAEWCQGNESNTVYDLAFKYDLLEHDSRENTAFYHSSQQNIDQDFVEELYSKSYEIYMNSPEGVHKSLGDYLKQRYTAIVESFGNDAKKVALANEFFGVFKMGVLSEEGAFSWFDVAADNGFQGTGLANLVWKGRGYKTIFDVLTKKYPDPNNQLPVYSKVSLKKEVTKISTLGDKIELECSDGTKVEAEHVIWTPSLGVLKHRHEKVFNPTLPNAKQNAIKVLGMGAVVKILYYFPQRWWPDDLDAFLLIWNEKDRQNLVKEFPYGPEINGVTWLASLQVFSFNPYNRNVLTGWVCGEAVPSIEKLQDDLIINGTMYLLQKFLGYEFQNLTWPQQIKRNNWYSNDHFRGTYSYDTLESIAESVSPRDVLSEPLTDSTGKPTVLFAGEATNKPHFGTVHGAIETGFREADRIINYYKAN